MAPPRHHQAALQRALCIVDHGLTGMWGHHLAYNLLVARLATSFELVEIFADRKFRSEKHPHVHASLNLLRLHTLKARLSLLFQKQKPERAFQPVPLDFRFQAEDCWEPVKMPFLIVKRLRAMELSWSVYRLVKARYAQAKEVHILFQDAGMEELFCLEMLRRFLKARAHSLTLHLVFRHVPQRTCSRVATMERFVNMLQRQSVLSYVRMYTDTEELSASFKSIIDAPGQFKTLPVPLLIEKLPPQRSPGTFRLGMLGSPRMEKGFGCLPALLGALPAKVGERPLELVVQTGAREPSSEIRAVSAILEGHAQKAAADPEALKLQLLPGPLSSAAYASCFAGLDCALILYCSPKYAASSSGIFVEALHLGIPSIVFAGTWMGKLIRQAAEEGLCIGLCVQSLGEVPAALQRIAKEQAIFSDAIAQYLVYHARRFKPELLTQTMFDQLPGVAKGKSGAQAC
ncbi:MAG: hypothetical protein FWG75_02575 [Cystobacterineae bacterium]|nr:hypothetical protein [Cystobacterineae bacterium]